MFSTRDLALMRVAQEAALPDLLTIKRTVRVDDGFGGNAKTSEVTVASNVPGRVIPGAVLEGLGQAGRPLDVKNYLVRVPVGTDLLPEDIVVTAGGDRLRIDQLKTPASWDTILTASAVVIA
jgi:hypothetical protein